MTVSYVDRQTLAAIAPDVQSKLGFGDAAFGLLNGAFAAAYVVGAPVAEWLIDRVGASRGLLASVLTWSAVAALHAVAPGFGVLVGMRVLLGLAEAPSFPAAAQTIQRALPPADRARGFGVVFTGSSIGAAIAAPLASQLAKHFGFRTAFFGTAAVGLLWVPVWLTFAFRAPARAALDRPQAVTAPGGRAISPFALAVHPAVLRSMLLVLASAPLLTVFYQWGTKYLVHDHGLTQIQAGALLWAPPLFFDAGAVLFGHLASSARKRGDGGVSRSLLAAAAALMLAGAIVPLAPTAPLAVAAMCAAMIGGGGMYALPMADVAARVPPGLVSSAGGLCASAQSIAQIVTNIAIGASIARYGSYRVVLIALSAWVVPCALVWLAWRAPPLHREEAEIQAEN